MEEEKKEEVEQKPKKSKHIKTIRGKVLTVYIVIIIIIAIALAYGCGFLLGKEMYDKKENKRENEPVPTEENVETKQLSLEDANKVMNQYKGLVISTEKLYGQETFNISNISIDEVLITAFSKLDIPEGDSLVVTLNDLNEKVGNYFENKTITINDIKERVSLKYPDSYTYDTEVEGNNISVRSSAENKQGEQIVSKITNAEQKGNNVYVYGKIAFGKLGNDHVNEEYSDLYYYKEYSDFAKTFEEKDHSKASETLKQPFNEAKVEPNWDLYNSYKYTFKLVNGTYYFQSLELVK